MKKTRNRGTQGVCCVVVECSKSGMRGRYAWFEGESITNHIISLGSREVRAMDESSHPM